MARSVRAVSAFVNKLTRTLLRCPPRQRRKCISEWRARDGRLGNYSDNARPASNIGYRISPTVLAHRAALAADANGPIGTASLWPGMRSTVRMAQLLLTPAAAALFVSQAHHLLDLRKAPWLPKSILLELTNAFRCREWTKPSEQLLLSRRQHPHPRGDDRARMTRARQAAEALFTPNGKLPSNWFRTPLWPTNRRANRAC